MKSWLATGFAIIALGFLAEKSYAQQPQINTGGIVNGASFAAGAPIAPGSIASVFGNNFGSSTDAVTVQVNGITSPLFAVSQQQINFQVPWELSGQSQASITVTVKGQTSNPITVSLASYAPGVFEVGSFGQGAVLIANTSSLAASAGAVPGSAPAAQGQFISIFCTGLGPVIPPAFTGGAVSGSPANNTTATPIVMIGQVPATVAFSGLAPGFLGLYQINVSVPLNTPTGSAIPLTVSIGGTTSNQVTIAISSSGPVLQQGGGPPGGDITALSVDPQNSHLVYAASGSFRVFKSSDGGASWTTSGTGITANVLSLATDPFTTSVVYAGTVFGFFKSSDGAVTWHPANVGLPTGASGQPAQVHPVVVDPSQAKRLYAVAAPVRVGVTSGLGSVVRSDDGGNTWTATAAVGSQNNFVLTLVIDSAGTLYAGTVPGGVYKSTDGGKSWVSINFSAQNTDVEFMAADPANPGTLYATATTGFIRLGPGNLLLRGSVDGMFKTTNGGASWMPVGGGIPTVSQLGFSLFAQGALTINPTNPSVLYLAVPAPTGLLKSMDGGISWIVANSGLSLNSGLTTVGVTSLALAPADPSILYAGTAADGVFASVDSGASWNMANKGLAAMSVRLVIIDPSNPVNVYVGNGSGVYKSADGGNSWAGANSGLPSAQTILLDPTNPGMLYAGVGATFGFYESGNGGVSWTLDGNGGLPPEGYTFFSLIIDPTQTSTLYGGTNGFGVFKSTDGGADWTPINNGLPNSSFVTALGLDPSNPSKVYVAVGNTAGGFFASTDGGATWSAQGAGLPVSGALAVLANSGTVYAGTSAGVYMRTNGATSWTAVNNGLAGSRSVSALGMDPSTGMLYAGVAGGIYRSSDGAATWAAASSGLPSAVSVVSFAFNPATPGAVYAGTNGAGLFLSRDSGATWQPTGLAMNAMAAEKQEWLIKDRRIASSGQ